MWRLNCCNGFINLSPYHVNEPDLNTICTCGIFEMVAGMLHS
jgi:hypothetical protein